MEATLESMEIILAGSFSTGEIREAEMTILDQAIRHKPDDLQTRMDYLNIARETLSSDRYLIELEKHMKMNFFLNREKYFGSWPVAIIWLNECR